MSAYQNESFSPSINILWSENLHLCNIEIHKWDVFNFKPSASSYMSHLCRAFLSKKKKGVLSEPGEKYDQIKHHLQVKTGLNSSQQICW